jgi:hypothetical protein
MAIELIDKIKPKNNGSFPMVDAEDVLMPSGKRLSEVPVGDDGDTCQLPEVTETDNGRFLQVENGKWTAVEILWQIIEVFTTCINDTFVPLEQSEYDAMVEAGTVEDNVYYLIAGDDE